MDLRTVSLPVLTSTKPICAVRSASLIDTAMRVPSADQSQGAMTDKSELFPRILGADGPAALTRITLSSSRPVLSTYHEYASCAPSGENVLRLAKSVQSPGP